MAGRRTAHGFEQPHRHPLHHAVEPRGIGQFADGEPQMDFRRELPARLLDPRHPAGGIEADDARADVDGGLLRHDAGFTDGDLAGAAADVDVHHPRVVAHRERGGTGAISGQRRFQRVAGAERNELAGLRREQLADGARIAPAHRHPGQDQRAGVDLGRRYRGQGVLPIDVGA